jgi:hypothetical protein
MLIIFGIHSFAKTLAMRTLVCGRCHNPAAHRLVQRSGWFTLFFIPLVPLGRTRYTVCAYCGVARTVSKSDAQQILRTAARNDGSAVLVQSRPAADRPARTGFIS